MKEALALHGPLSAALWVNENFSSYEYVSIFFLRAVTLG